MNQDLKSRIPVAIAYVLSIALMTILGAVPTCILLFLFFILCLTEFIEPNPASNSGSKIYYYGASLLLLILSLLVLPISSYNLELVYISCLFFVVNALYLLIQKKTLLTIKPLYIIVLIYLIIPFIISLRLSLSIIDFPLILLGTFIILWLNDAGAYFIGKAFGKTKLFPSVSPSKTWAGFIGGGFVGLLISYPIFILIGIFSLSNWLILSLIIWISGTIGDLSESSWKRYYGIKDSGTFLKGHGGFLDRLDSFIYAIPFVSLYVLYIFHNL